MRKYRIFNVETQKLERALVLHPNGTVFENGKKISKKRFEKLKIFFDIGVKYKDGSLSIEGDIIDFDVGYGVLVCAYGYPVVKLRSDSIELCSLDPLPLLFPCGNIFEKVSRELIACSFKFSIVQGLCQHFGVKFPCYTKR